MAQRVKLPPAILVSQMGTDSCRAVPFPIQVPADMPEKMAEGGPSPGSLPPMWKTQKKLLSPDFSLAQPWPLQSLGD